MLKISIIRYTFVINILMMGLIALEGMRFHAYHGFYDEEQVMGNDYILDVHITTDNSIATLTGDLYQTINYETIYEICKIAMRKKAKLLETITERIANDIKFQFEKVQEVKVRLKKVNPPLGGHVDFAVVETDGTIALEGMHFHAYHGFYEEEQIMGNDYSLDVSVMIDTTSASETDDLYKTVNYETIYEISKMVMSEKAKLLETITERIIDALKHQFNNIQEVKVCLKKINPALGGHVDFVSVKREEDFINQCGRCRRPMICYKDNNCWCKNIVVHERTQEAIAQQYKNCLCQSCLQFFAN
jgi:7,8-dihydroneopterin aldolase/epimerase/oxygenase